MSQKGNLYTEPYKHTTKQPFIKHSQNNRPTILTGKITINMILNLLYSVYLE